MMRAEYTLPCGHAFHKNCIRDLCRAAGPMRVTHCPLCMQPYMFLDDQAPMEPRTPVDPSESCTICLCEMRGTLYALPCNHVYHRACLTDWVNQSAKMMRVVVCPDCDQRCAIPGSSERAPEQSGGPPR